VFIPRAAGFGSRSPTATSSFDEMRRGGRQGGHKG